MKPVNEDSSTALAFKSRKAPKGDRSSKEPHALFHLPSHHLSMHSNVECRTQNPSLAPTRPAQQARPMGQSNTNVAPSPLRSLAAIAGLSDSEKARLFDHLQNAHANSAASQPPPNNNAPPSTSSTDQSNQVVYFANVYSAMAQSSTKCDDMISDSGADRFIFHSIKRFINL